MRRGIELLVNVEVECFAEAEERDIVGLREAIQDAVHPVLIGKNWMHRSVSLTFGLRYKDGEIPTRLKRITTADAWMAETGAYAMALRTRVGEENYKSITATMDEFAKQVIQHADCSDD
jgi:hypothetical protein